MIPPTSKLNLIKTWWKRSRVTGEIAERRLLEGKTYKVQTKAGQINTFRLGSEGNRNLVICHGYGAGLGFFYRNYRGLAKEGWKIFGIDWIGMGNSERIDWRFKRSQTSNWESLVDKVEDHFIESLEEWRKKVGIEKMVLAGHSLGGYLVSCYSLRYPERVEKLILISPAGIEENQWMTEKSLPRWLSYLWNHNVTPFSIIRSLGPVGAHLVHLYTKGRFQYLEEAERYRLYDYIYHISASRGSGEYALAALLAPGAHARKPLIHRLENICSPVVFIYGEYDWMDYRAAIKAKKEMSTQVQIYRIPGGHHMYLDYPESFNEIIRQEMEF